MVRPQKLPAANPGQVASPAQAASALGEWNLAMQSHRVLQLQLLILIFLAFLGHGGVTGGSRPQKFLVSHPPTAPSHHQAAVTTTAKLGQ